MYEESRLNIQYAYANDGEVVFSKDTLEWLASIEEVEEYIAIGGVPFDGLIEVIEGIYEWQGDDGYVKVDLPKRKKPAS